MADPDVTETVWVTASDTHPGRYAYSNAVRKDGGSIRHAGLLSSAALLPAAQVGAPITITNFREAQHDDCGWAAADGRMHGFELGHRPDSASIGATCTPGVDLKHCPRLEGRWVWFLPQNLSCVNVTFSIHYNVYTWDMHIREVFDGQDIPY